MSEIDHVLWVAHHLFDKGLVSGSTGNISFRVEDHVYISKSGSCFGLLNHQGFAKMSLDGTIIEGKPSKEWPMHLKLYQQNQSIKAIIHTHSFYSTLVSCINKIETKKQELFAYTPYLKMQTGGMIGVVDYADPGSKELFDQFNQQVSHDTNTYILKNHGVLVGAENVLKAFYLIEEFEQTCKLYVNINHEEFNKIKGTVTK